MIEYFVEFDLRLWLLLLGLVFVCVILLHGYWRLKRTNSNDIKVTLDERYLSKPGEEQEFDEWALVKAELPNGGARIVSRPTDAEQTEVGELTTTEQPDSEGIEFEQAGIEETDVEETGYELNSIEDTEVEESGMGQTEQLSKDIPVLMDRIEPDEANNNERTITTELTQPSQPAVPEPIAETESAPTSQQEPELAVEQEHVPTAEQESGLSVEQAPEQSPAMETVDTGMEENAVPDEFIIVYVIAKEGKFPGLDLLGIMEELDMTFGDMDIFHYMNEQGKSMFSLANAVEPGTFDPPEMGDLLTPGVTLFMSVTGLVDPMRELDQLMNVASHIADELGGVILDGSRQVITEQSLEIYRQNIRDFQFRHSA